MTGGGSQDGRNCPDWRVTDHADLGSSGYCGTRGNHPAGPAARVYGFLGAGHLGEAAS